MKTFINRFFTLIELLVVISIILILISILLPALGKAKIAAKSISCANTMKQLGTVITMYVDDSSGYYPHYYADGLTWTRQVGPSYFNLKPMNWQEWGCKLNGMICPASAENPSEEIFIATYGGQSGWVTSYGMNTKFSYKKASSLTSPSMSYLFTDAKKTYMVYKPWYPDKISLRHALKSNTVFGDGHVGWFGTDLGKDASWEVN